MKSIEYSFSNADIEDITFALSILPSLGLESSKIQADINYKLCVSASSKLINHNVDILPNEFRVILSSLQAVQLINKSELTVDPQTKKDCARYLLTVNKLVCAFDI